MEGKLKFNENGAVVMDPVQFLKNALFRIAFVAANRKSEEGEKISDAKALDYIQMVAGDVLRYFKIDFNNERPNMEDIQEIKGMFEDGFYVNTGVTEFIDAVLSAPGNLIGIGELKEPIIIDRDLCIRISKMHYIKSCISDSPTKDKYFYVNTGILSFIHRVLKARCEMMSTTGPMTKKDYLLEVFRHPLVCSAITEISAAS